MKKLLLLVMALCLSLGMAQTFVYQRGFDVTTLDPLGASDDFSRAIVENTYEGLYGYNAASNEFEPLLATSYEVSDDGLTHTFHLRGAVTFHSGNPFNCKDVEYSIKRALVIGQGLLTQPLLGVSYDANEVLGDDGTDAEYADYWARIERSVECSDDKTVVIRTLGPDPILVAKLQSLRYSIVDSEWAKAGGMWDGTESTWRDWVGVDLADQYLHDKMSGTGAYQLVSWEPGVRVVAKADPNYWGGAPQIDTVIYQVVEDEDARIQALLAGVADEIDLDDTPPARLVGQPGVRVLNPAKDPSLDWGLTSVWAMHLNHAIMAEDNDLIGSGKLDGRGIPPDFFSDLDVRECFAYAFDPGASNQGVNGGDGETLTMALPPDYLGYDPDVPKYAFDLAKAEDHCRAAWGGRLWDNGMYFVFPYANGSTVSKAAGRIMKENLESLNSKFTVEVRAVDWEDFGPLADKPRLPIELICIPAVLPDPVAFTDDLYRSTYSFAGFYAYENAEMDRLIEEACSEFDGAERAQLYRQVGRLDYEDLPFVLVPSGPLVMVLSDKISGAHRNPMYATVRW